MRLATTIIAMLLAQSAYATEICRSFNYSAYERLSDRIIGPDMLGYYLENPGRQGLGSGGVDFVRRYLHCDGEEVAHVGDLRTMVFLSPLGGQVLAEWQQDILVGITQSGLRGHP